MNHILVNFTVFHLINQKTVYVIVLLLFFSLQMEANFKSFVSRPSTKTLNEISYKGAESTHVYLEYDPVCILGRKFCTKNIK